MASIDLYINSRRKPNLKFSRRQRCPFR